MKHKMKHVEKYLIWLTDMFSVVLIVTKATNEILLLLLCAEATFLYGLSSVMAEIDFILENYFTVVSHCGEASAHLAHLCTQATE